MKRPTQATANLIHSFLFRFSVPTKTAQGNYYGRVRFVEEYELAKGWTAETARADFAKKVAELQEANPTGSIGFDPITNQQAWVNQF